jgi:hypothetical protein
MRRLENNATGTRPPRDRDDIRRVDGPSGRPPGDETREEIGRIAAEFQAPSTRPEAGAIGVIYARSSTGRGDGVAEQVRACYRAAAGRGIFVPADHVFCDATSGRLEARRPGLARALALVRAGDVDAFLAHSADRLGRDADPRRGLVEEELVGRGVRVIFTGSGVDDAGG